MIIIIKKILKKGTINNKKLLDYFGTPSNIAYYKKNKKIVNSTKKRLLEKASECFYGSKAFDFCNMLSDRLKEKNIMYFYDSYEIYYTNLDRCKKLFKEFKQCKEEDILIKEFNKFFIEYIINKAELRKNKQKELENELHKYRLDDNYIANIKTLSDLTIDINTEKYRIKKQSNVSYMEKIDEDFGLTVNKKYKDKTIKKEI